MADVGRIRDDKVGTCYYWLANLRCTVNLSISRTYNTGCEAMTYCRTRSMATWKPNFQFHDASLWGESTAFLLAYDTVLAALERDTIFDCQNFGEECLGHWGTRQ